MAKVGSERSANLSSFLGLDNRRPDFKLHTKDGEFLRAAANVDISDALTVKRRQGTTRAIAGARCHSLWTDYKTGSSFYVDAGNLYQIRASTGGEPERFVAAANVGDRPLSFAGIDEEIVFSDGGSLRTIVAGWGVARQFGIDPPNVIPTLLPLGEGSGSLDAGSYAVGIAYRNEWNEYSGMADAVFETVEAKGALVVAGLPLVWPAGVVELVIYAAPSAAGTLFKATSVSAPTASVTLTTIPSRGQTANTMGFISLPAGNILRYWGSRMYSAAGDTLWFSRPFSPALCNPGRDYIQLLAPITVMEPCDNGMFIVADRTYWLSDDPEKATLVTVSPLKGLAYSSGIFDVDNKPRCYWMTDHGLVVGSPDGSIELVQDEHVFMQGGQVGASLFREADGARQIISSVFGAGQSVTAARSYMDAEIVRKGTSV